MKWQRVLLDRLIGRSYLAVVALLVGCASGRLGPILPTGMVPGESGAAEAWVRSTRLDTNRLVRFRFQYRDDQGAAGGRGSIRITPGDSLRFDVIGALGVGRGAAFVRGDSAIWAQPEEEIAKLVPNYPLLWAMLGIARPPARGAEVRQFRDDRVLAWQFVLGADTVEYVRTGAPGGKLIADVRQSGQRIGRVETLFGPDGIPVSSRLVVPSGPARLDLNYTSTTAPATLEAATWDPPPP